MAVYFIQEGDNGMSFKKAEKQFRNTQLKDRLDDQFCKENDVILHRIRYDEDKEKSISRLRNRVNNLCN